MSRRAFLFAPRRRAGIYQPVVPLHALNFSRGFISRGHDWSIDPLEHPSVDELTSRARGRRGRRGIRNHDDDDDDDERPRLLNHHVRGVRQRAHDDQAHRDQRYDDAARRRCAALRDAARDEGILRTHQWRAFLRCIQRARWVRTSAEGCVSVR